MVAPSAFLYDELGVGILSRACDTREGEKRNLRWSMKVWLSSTGRTLRAQIGTLRSI